MTRESPSELAVLLRAQDDIWSGVHPSLRRKLILSGGESFYRDGYHATTTRDISVGAGISPAGMYVHFPSKEDLLFEIEKGGHLAVASIVDKAAAQEASAPARLENMVRANAEWHAFHHFTAKVINHELAALGPEHLEEILAIRRGIDRTFAAVVRAGIEAGQFTTEDERGTVIAILSLCVDVSRWYQPGGRYSPAQIGDIYAGLAAKMLR